MRDRHLDIVCDDGELVGRLAVGSEDDEILDVGPVELDRPVDEILDQRRAFGHAEANGARRLAPFARRDLCPRQRRAGAIVAPRRRALGSLALRLELIGRTVAVVGTVGSDQTFDHRSMTIDPLRLEVGLVRTANPRPFVPIEPEPPQAVEYAFDHLRRRPAGIGVLDAQHEHAAVTPRKQPVEERGPGAADMQIAGRGGREPDSRRGHRADSRAPTYFTIACMTAFSNSGRICRTGV